MKELIFRFHEKNVDFLKLYENKNWFMGNFIKKSSRGDERNPRGVFIIESEQPRAGIQTVGTAIYQLFLFKTVT